MTQKMLRPLLIVKGIFNYVYWNVGINMVYVVLERLYISIFLSTYVYCVKFSILLTYYMYISRRISNKGIWTMYGFIYHTYIFSILKANLVSTFYVQEDISILEFQGSLCLIRRGISISISIFNSPKATLVSTCWKTHMFLSMFTVGFISIQISIISVLSAQPSWLRDRRHYY